MSDIQVWEKESGTDGTYFFFIEKGGRLEGVFIHVDKQEDPWLVLHVEVWENDIQFMLDHIQASYKKISNFVGSPLLNIVDQILERLENGSVV